MATLLYLAKWYFSDFGAMYDFDTYWFLLYLALDSQLFFRWWVWKHPHG